MSMEEHFKLVSRFLAEQKFSYALIGAFALKAYGYSRATKDIDFITRFEYKSRIIKYLESLGYETLQNTDAFTNHLHPIGQTRVDFLYVSGATADEIFTSLEYKEAFDDVAVPVPSPKHLLALKLFAAKSNSNRRTKDIADIKALARCVNLDRQTIEQYTRKYGQEDMLDELFR
jgi:hypothetical protein